MTRDEKKAKARWEYVSDRLCNSDYPIYNEEHELESAFDAGVKWCEEHPNWISVEDALPTDHEWMLAYMPTHDVRIDVVNFDNNGLVEVMGITHWMLLPQPPSSSEIPNNYKKGGEQ